MATSKQPHDRFRSATEFPKTVENLSLTEANDLYGEMRSCLIFTNRSRSQLMRRNEEYKQSTLTLKADLSRLQTMITQLGLEKQQLSDKNYQTIAELEREMGTMAQHLDQLATAFDAVPDVDTSTQTHWGLLAQSGRFFRFIRAVRTIVMWWRDDQELNGRTLPVKTEQSLPTQQQIEDDRRENPQMYTDPASQGKSLLDP
ncbi:hypothetical protein IQ268_01600 [Oculatella sp. LEGE 06141]|uniref:hypothetical protein n=1 Tax=Oculatella sp. LEGE 06141 TaxID=1828648 RepID=UPI00187E7CFD|nr:hypothetical protein [Oculatella sp. LEGE 06141]MBE9177268.1 hypothetical protein [Oculatella sp. LEGE 06141]